MSDAEKLEALADWLDLKDLASGTDGNSYEVQMDLRRIARRLREIDTQHKEG